MATQRTSPPAPREGAGSQPSSDDAFLNVGSTERWISAVGGTALAGYGLSRRTLPGAVFAVLGGVVAYRGLRGHCPLYGALGVNTATPEQSGIDVQSSVTIDKRADELYRFWRDVENLPHFMRHLDSVTALSDTRSHWVAKAPAGAAVEWDAEITEDRANELLAWRSLPGADVENEGEVRFEPAPGGRGTVVRVHLRYRPPMGVLGAAIAKLFGEEPNQQIADDLRRFKRLMEAGEIPTTEGQPRGERSMLGKMLSPQS